MPRFRIEHLTRYRYAQGVDLNYAEARLLPRDTPEQSVLESRLDISPVCDDYRERVDAWGNRVVWFMSQRPHRALSVTAHSLLQTRPRASSMIGSPPWEEAMQRLSGSEVEYRMESPMIPAHRQAAEYARASFPPGRPLLEAVADLSARIHREFCYQPSATHIDTPLDEVLEHRHGVCQDFAHLALAGLRGLGLAARYVSGYLETTPPEGQARQIGADASHAWIGIWLPGGVWHDFDPTNGCAAGESHLSLAWGRDYGDVAPLKGVIHGGGTHQLEVGVTVTRLPDTP